MRPGILTLFSYDWDAQGLSTLSQDYRFVDAGFDLFTFPSNARLLTFDMAKWVDSLARRYHPPQIAGVLSHHEQFGALAAALLTRRLGLPGTAPEAVIRCQHKLLSRQLLQQVAPQANLPFFQLPCEYGEPAPDGLDYPLFIKPVKAAYSVLARRVDNRNELARLIDFGFFETWIIRRLVKPFNDIARALLPGTPDANHMIAEAPMRAAQFNLDGWMYRGHAHLLGVCDEIMYPGTQAFLRFAYPSQLPPSIQQRAFDIARRFLLAAGFDHGFFNMEFFYDQASDRLTVIEFNPRLSSQLADLYQRVDGLQVHAMSLALACGDDPLTVPRLAPRGGAAASFVFRSFGAQSPGRAPTDADLAWFAAQHPDGLLLRFAKQGSGLRREIKWLGSHRYAVVHFHGDDEPDLHRRYLQFCRQFGWHPQW